MAPPVCFKTIFFLTSGHFFKASSVFFLSGIDFLPLTPSSAVITYSDLQSIILPARDSGENPPNTTE